jgi:hypothetical protein
MRVPAEAADECYSRMRMHMLITRNNKNSLYKFYNNLLYWFENKNELMLFDLDYEKILKFSRKMSVYCMKPLYF